MKKFEPFLILLLLVVACGAGEPLSLERLQEIIAAEHDEKALVEGLRIYPKARAYNITITNRTPDGQSFTGRATATEKWIDGRFIVSEAQPGGEETKFAIVVEYDADEKLYRKYVVMGGKVSGYQVGTRIEGARSVSWIDLSPMKFEPGMDNLTTETHTDKQTTWRSMFFQGGELQRVETGIATVAE